MSAASGAITHFKICCCQFNIPGLWGSERSGDRGINRPVRHQFISADSLTGSEWLKTDSDVTGNQDSCRWGTYRVGGEASVRPRDADEVCASVSSEVMEEGGRTEGGGGVDRAGEVRRWREKNAGNAKKKKKVQGELMGCKASWQQFHWRRSRRCIPEQM